MNSNTRPNGQGGGAGGAGGAGYNRRQVYPPAAQNGRSQAVSMIARRTKRERVAVFLFLVY